VVLWNSYYKILGYRPPRGVSLLIGPPFWEPTLSSFNPNLGHVWGCGDLKFFPLFFRKGAPLGGEFSLLEGVLKGGGIKPF